MIRKPVGGKRVAIWLHSGVLDKILLDIFWPIVHGITIDHLDKEFDPYVHYHGDKAGLGVEWVHVQLVFTHELYVVHPVHGDRVFISSKNLNVVKHSDRTVTEVTIP